MPTYLSPGVFFEEVTFDRARLTERSLPSPDLDVADRLTRRWPAEHTATGFVGMTSRGPFDEPVLLQSWGQFEASFGGSAVIGDEPATLAMAVAGFFANGGQSCWVVGVDGSAEHLVNALVGGGEGRGIGALEALREVSLVCAPDLWVLNSSGVIDQEAVHAVQLALIAHCELMGDRLAILDCPPGLTSRAVRDWRMSAGFDSSFATLYYPWIKVFDVESGRWVLVPPCGHVAGVYARTDAVRGFHHAPANQPIAGALTVETLLSRDDLDLLNPAGLNAIVPSPGRGLLVWGNRTLSSDPQRRFIHQRRVMSFISRTLTHATEWAVFERADDETLGPRILAEVREFLLLLWRSGALWGHRPEVAFWVDVAPHSVDENRVVIECEFAVEKDQRLGFRLDYNLG